jgi:nucleoside-diphosphate-sugar epimerase
MSAPSEQFVLVTGGSGFVGAWCIIKLLDAGYKVRATVRSQKREKDVLDMLKVGGASRLSDVSFVTADLMKDEGWKEAVSGCTYVLHVASPFPSTAPKHEDDLIIPAREGTLRVLRAARDAGVKRVVVTSSSAAVAYGHPPGKTSFTEEDWSIVDRGGISPYQKSKTLAERAAWDFMKKEGGSLEMSVVNPVGIFGPVLGPDYATSIILIRRLMEGDMPGVPQLYMGVVDVRDCADMHLLAMTSPKAAGERFVAVGDEEMSIAGMSKLLHEKMPEAAKRVPTRHVPNFVVRIVGLWDKEAAGIVHELNRHRMPSNEKAKRVLGWMPRSSEEAVLASAESLVNLKLLK